MRSFHKTANRKFAKTKEEIQAEITTLSELYDSLDVSMTAIKKITTTQKYDNTPLDIMSEIESTYLSKFGISPGDWEDAKSAVFEAQTQLTSAVYALEDVFKDKLDSISLKLDESQMDLEDYDFVNRQEPRA